MAAANVPNEKEEPPQPLGLVPLYPFPPLQAPRTDKSKLPMTIPNFGFTFLPPIYQQAHYYATKTYYSDSQLRSEAEEILDEVATEEVLNLLEEVIVEGTRPSPRAIKQLAKQENNMYERICKEIVYNLVADVVNEECYDGVIAFYDDLILDHRQNSEYNIISQGVYESIALEVIEEIASEVYENCVCGEICMSIIHELVCDEALSVSNDVLIHYGARVAFSQYKSITKCAADLVLDSMCVQSLLPKPAPSSAPTLNVLDHMMLEVLLKRAIQLQNDSQEFCFPLKWFRRKAVLDIAMNLAIDKLEEALDTLIPH